MSMMRWLQFCASEADPSPRERFLRVGQSVGPALTVIGALLVLGQTAQRTSSWATTADGIELQVIDCRADDRFENRPTAE